MGSSVVSSSFHLFAQMSSLCALVLGALLSLLSLRAAVEAGKCPKTCSCDSAKLTVACVGQNLNQVPSTVDEVRPCIYVFYKIVNVGPFRID